MRAVLAAGTGAGRAAAGEAAAERVAALAPFRAARRVALYLALPREMPTAPLVERCAREGRAMAVPVFDPETGVYRLAEYDPALPLRRGPLGIAEPAAPRWLDASAPDFWIVPGLAFDARGGRLGRGAGWYDRLLAGVAAPRAGWAFDRQVVPAVPMEARDVRMDFIVTERRKIVCRPAAIPPKNRRGAPFAPREKRP